jgi:NAD(P)-dependent dehydrogenase (short-subunit alcohol dehydrogenase family)
MPRWVQPQISDGLMDMLAQLQGSDRHFASRSVTRHQAIARFARTDEVAAVVAVLAGPDPSYLTATVLTMDGGSLAVDPGNMGFADAMAALSKDERGAGT